MTHQISGGVKAARIIGVITVILAMIVIGTGIVLISISTPKCVLPNLSQINDPACDPYSDRRRVGVTMVIAGGVAVVIGGFVMVFDHILNSGTLISAMASMSAAVAAIAAASAANSATTKSASQLPIDTTTIGNIQSLLTTAKQTAQNVVN